MPEEKLPIRVSELARTIAKSILNAERSPSKGQAELSWFQFGALFISVSISLSLAHSEEREENRYYQDMILAASRNPKQLAKRLLEQSLHAAEVLDTYTPEQIQEQLDRFKKEMKDLQARGGKV